MGIGALLVLAGILFSHSEKIKEGAEYVAAELAKQRKTQEKIAAKSLERSFPHIQTQNLRPSEPEIAPIKVSTAQRAPKFFSKEAHLYLDNSKENAYCSKEDSLEISNISEIHRVGKGSFFYDGSRFIFEHENIRQHYSIDSLSHIAFYPNCIVLVSKNDLPAALFFMDDTKSVRRILETFRTDRETNAV